MIKSQNFRFATEIDVKTAEDQGLLLECLSCVEFASETFL